MKDFETQIGLSHIFDVIFSGKELCFPVPTLHLVGGTYANLSGLTLRWSPLMLAGSPLTVEGGVVKNLIETILNVVPRTYYVHDFLLCTHVYST